MSGDLKPLISFASPLAILGFLTSVIKGLFSGSVGSALFSGFISAVAMGLLGIGIYFLLKNIMPELFEANTITGGSVRPAAVNSPAVSNPVETQSPVEGGELSSSSEDLASGSASVTNSIADTHSETEAAVQKRKAAPLGTGEIDVEGIPITDDRGKMAQVIQHLMDQDDE